ncbi:MAG: Ig-like domain-containing protein [Halanaerobiaceae bacterium]
MELNIPSVNINSPINEQMLSGDIIISGSVSDDSDILDVFISLINSDGYLKSEKHLGNKKNWSLSLDTTKYPNGEYTIEVYAVDEYGNRSYKEGISVDIVN